MSRREFNRLETQRHIRNVFLEQYKQKGIDDITVSELCEKADVGKSTFYLYYDDKYSVLEAIEEDLLTGLEKIYVNVEKHSEDYLFKNIPMDEVVRTVDFIREHLEEFKTIMGPKGDTSFEYRWRQRITETFLKFFKKEKKSMEESDFACAFFAATLLGIYRHMIFSDSNLSKEKVSKIAGDMLKYIQTNFN